METVNKVKNQAELEIEALAKKLRTLACRITKNADNLTVGGSIDLQGTQIMSLPDNLTVGGPLYLRDTQITSLPDNLTVGGSLYLQGTQITSLPDNLTVGGYLDLQGTQITSLPDNLTVGGSIDLQGTQITSLPDNLTVGGSLYLRGTQITSLPDNLTVGGSIDLRGTQITSPEKLNRPPADFSIKVRASIEIAFNLRGYTIADGILGKIVGKRGLILRIIIAGRKGATYLASDGNGNSAHGETIKEARDGLAFKTASRDVSQFKGMKLTEKKAPKEWAFIYRIITGACQSGTEHFIAGKGKLKAEYTLAEILEQTNGAFGYDRFKSIVTEVA